MTTDTAPVVDRQNPWPGLAPFTEDLRDFFHGRSAEADDLLRLVRRETLTVLFGQSGLGKTSLLQAGLFPLLRDQQLIPIYIRLNHDPAAPALADQVLQAIAQTIIRGELDAPSPGPSEPLWDYLHRKDVEFWTARNRPATPVLVFDQFEELFTLGRATESARRRGQVFITELAEVIENRTPSRIADGDDTHRYQFESSRCKVILSLREDFLPDLEELRTEIRSLTRNRMRITRMTGEQAMQVVQKPGGDLVTPGVAQEIVRFVAGGARAANTPIENLEIEPALLSVVCCELNLKRLAAGQPAITADLLAGNRREILADFYQRSIVDLPVLVRTFIEDHLLTPSGYRDSVAIDTALAEGLDRTSISTLISRRLLRTEDRFGLPRIELTHDVLADPVKASRDARRQKSDLEKAQNQARQAAAQLKTARLRLRATVAIIAIMVVLTSLATALAVYAWQQKKLASGRTNYANYMAGLAATAKDDARTKETQAEQSAKESESLLAHSLVHQADAWVALGRISDARSAYADSWQRLGNLGESQFLAEAGLSNLNSADPPALRTFRGHAGWIHSVAFSPDGRTAISGSEDGTLKLWGVLTGNEIRTFRAHKSPVLSVAFSPDGHTVISGQGDNTLTLWNVDTGNEIRSFRGHEDKVWGVAFSPDGNQVLSGSADKMLKLWNVATGDEIRTFRGHEGAVWSVAFSPDGLSALSGSTDRTLKLWDLASGNEIRTFHGHREVVEGVAFSPDGRNAISGSGDRTLKLWDVASGTEIRAFVGHKSEVWSVAFNPDGNEVVSAGLDGTLIMWDVASGTELRSFRGHEDSVGSVAFSPNGCTVLSGSYDKTLKLWETVARDEARKFYGHQDSVQGVALSPDGRTALSGSTDSTLRVWDVATGIELRTFRGHANSVWSVAFSPDGREVLSGSADKTIKLWDVASGTELRTFDGHENEVTSVAFSPDGHTLISGGYDRTIRLWDLVSGKEIRVIRGHKGNVNSVAISADGRTALSGGADETVKIWDIAKGHEIFTLDLHLNEVRSVAFSPDGHTVLSGSDDDTLKLWDGASGTEIRAFRGHDESVESVAFSPDGSVAISGSADKTVKLWDVATGNEIATLRGHEDTVQSVAFSPDGRAILSGSDDKTVIYRDFSRVDRYIEFDTSLAAAQATLQKSPNDPKALFVLGDWYAFRGKNDWAIELLEKARAAGADVPPLMLGRCYWELSRDIPKFCPLTHEQCLAAAQREYGKALAAAGNDRDRFYLQLCISALDRDASTTQPSTQP